MVRSRLIVGVGLFAVFVALGAIAVLSSRSDVDQYEPGTPEATVQEYFQAIIDDRPGDAVALIDADLGCNNQLRPGVRISRVVLDNVDYNNERSEATVRVQITETWGDSLFGPDESTFTETIHLAADYADSIDSGASAEDGVDSRWFIVEPPWPYFDCRPGG